MSYTKLFSHIVTSTIWREPKEVKILWITMLALSNKHGEVMASVPGLADMARLTLEETKLALEVLESPDEYSRTPDNEGRRLLRIDGGWHVLNYGKHRRMASLDERREMNAARQRRFYEKHKKQQNLTENLTLSHGVVTPNNAHLTQSSDIAEAEAEAEAEYKENLKCDEKERSASKPGKPVSPTPRKRKTVKKSDMTSDEVFLAELKRHYPDIDIDREFRKMRAWLLTPKGKGKVLTRQRIINWLNRVDAPVALGFDNGSNGQGRRVNAEFEKAKAVLTGLTREEWDNGSRRIDEYWRNNTDANNNR